MLEFSSKNKSMLMSFISNLNLFSRYKPNLYIIYTMALKDLWL